MPSSSSTTRMVVAGDVVSGGGLVIGLTYVASTSPASGATFATPMPADAVRSLAAVRGLTVGHWTDARTATGCTVVLAPPGGMRASAALRGRATGTRELDALHPRHLVGHVDALLLTGGSAYGLGAAGGGVGWLKQRGRGLPIGAAGGGPLVPTPGLFDFDLAPPGRAGRRPRPAHAHPPRPAAGPGVAPGA